MNIALIHPYLSLRITLFIREFIALNKYECKIFMTFDIEYYEKNSIDIHYNALKWEE